MKEPIPEGGVHEKAVTQFLTAEQREAGAKNSFAPYWQLDDSLCRRFLVGCAGDPSTFETRKVLFPFFRDGVLYGVRRDRDAAHVWMTAAFFAGWFMGRRHPDAALAVVEAADEVGASLHRLDRIRRALGHLPPEPPNVLGVMRNMVVQWDSMEPNETDALLVDQTVKLIHAGGVAATRAQLDASLSDFAGRVHFDEANPNDALHLRAWVRGLADSYGVPVIEQLRHPLLRVGAEYYVDRPIQWSVMKAALERVLAGLKVRSQLDCPHHHAELIALVKAGLKAGQELRRARPDDLDAIREEAGREEWKEACRIVSEVMRDANSTQPSALLEAINRWHQQTCGAGDGSYGWELTRAVRIFDFAVWAGWLIPLDPSRGAL